MRLQGDAAVAVVRNESDVFRLGIQLLYHADIGLYVILINKSTLNRRVGKIVEEIQRFGHPRFQVCAMLRQKHHIAAGQCHHHRHFAPDGVLQRQIGCPRFLSYKYYERRNLCALIFGKDAHHSLLPPRSLGETFAVHVLQFYPALPVQALKLFHKVGNIARSLARVRIIRTDDKHRMVARHRKGRARKEKKRRQAEQCSIKYILK